MKRKQTTSKKLATDSPRITWDDLILLANEQIGKNVRKTSQFEALVRHFRSRRQAGEPCPIQPESVY